MRTGAVIIANLEITGLDELNEAFRKISEIPFEVTSKALTSMATVAASKIKQSGETMRIRDSESNEHILDKIKVSKPKKTDSGGYAEIGFSGTRRRGRQSTSNSYIAFVNEYGKRGQATRPFVSTAIEQNQNAIASPGEEIILGWIEKNFK